MGYVCFHFRSCYPVDHEPGLRLHLSTSVFIQKLSPDLRTRQLPFIQKPGPGRLLTLRVSTSYMTARHENTSHSITPSVRNRSMVWSGSGVFSRSTSTPRLEPCFFHRESSLTWGRRRGGEEGGGRSLRRWRALDVEVWLWGDGWWGGGWRGGRKERRQAESRTTG